MFTRFVCKHNSVVWKHSYLQSTDKLLSMAMYSVTSRLKLEDLERIKGVIVMELYTQQ